MRLVRLLAASAVLVCSSLAGQAQAAKIFTLSGTLSPDQNGSASIYAGQLQSGQARGAYVSFSQPVSGNLSVYLNMKWNIFDKNHNEIDGNEFDYDLVTPLNNTRQGRVSFHSPVIPLHVNGWRYFEFAFGTSPLISLNSLSGPVNYTISGFSAAPEPTTWALMILGFGAIGAMARRRRSSGDVGSGIVKGTPCTVIGG